jgi:DNA-directed RNA polymerases I, II, and III subunit RPABC2
MSKYSKDDADYLGGPDAEEEEEEPTKKKGGAESDDESGDENDDASSNYDEYDDPDADSDADDDDDDDDDAEQIEKEMKEGLVKRGNKGERPIELEFDENEYEDEDDDDEDEELEDEDETYYQRFHENMKKNVVEDFHPEMKYNNYDEIEALTEVVRDTNGRIIDPNHQTMPFVTKYEKARILGERAKQINSGAKPFVEVDADVIDGYLIALKEFEQKKIPFIVKRPVAGDRIEYWKLSDLEIL